VIISLVFIVVFIIITVIGAILLLRIIITSSVITYLIVSSPSSFFAPQLPPTARPRERVRLGRNMRVRNARRRNPHTTAINGYQRWMAAVSDATG
jgi:hypothetical protein